MYRKAFGQQVMNITFSRICHHLTFAAAGLGCSQKDVRGCAVLSKCANPACCEQFLRLGQGKVFHFAPTPQVAGCSENLSPELDERFWLCERCCKRMTVVWGGDRPQLVQLASRRVTELHPPKRFRTRP